MERARALPPEEQDALAEEMEAWLEGPPPPDDFGADGSDEELAERVRAWNANPKGVTAADLHVRLKRLRERT